MKPLHILFAFVLMTGPSWATGHNFQGCCSKNEAIKHCTMAGELICGNGEASTTCGCEVKRLDKTSDASAPRGPSGDWIEVDGERFQVIEVDGMGESTDNSDGQTGSDAFGNENRAVNQ